MIKYNSNTIKDWYYDSSDLIKVYYHNAVCYYKISNGGTPTFDGKWKATYSDSSVVTAECDSSSAITQNEITLTNLAEVEIGDCVTNIGMTSFSVWGGSTLSSVTIGNNVTTIGDWAFGLCSSLTSIDIPNSVTTIGNNAFQGCTSLSSCTIGSGVTTIFANAFSYCNGLTSIVIQDSVTSIGAYAFNSCTSLTTCTIGSGVTSIGESAFQDCSGLTSITIKATTPPTLGEVPFYDTNNCPIYVPSASVNAYKSASGWSDYADRIQAIP